MSGADREYIPHSAGCFMCGDENRCGVQARFFVEGDAVCARVSIPPHHNGYRGIAHGGVVAAILDESMAWAATVFGGKRSMYLTGELTVKYAAGVPVGKEVLIRSRLEKDMGRVAYCMGEISHEGRVCARAAGKFLPMDAGETARVVTYLKFEDCRKYRTLFGPDKEGG